MATPAGADGTAEPDTAAPAAPPGRGRWVTVVLGLLAGLCICFALPPWGWWPLAPVGIALFIHVLGPRGGDGHGRPRRARERAGIGWLVGVAWFGPSTLWMAQLTPPGYVLGVLVAWGGMVAAVAAVCPGDRRRIVALPALLVLFEWFHLHAPFGGIPLSLLATTQTRAPLLPVARLGGVLLLGLAVSTIGAALYLLATRRWLGAAVAAVAVAAVALVGAAWPIGDPVAQVRVAGVQGGGPQGTRYSSADAPIVFGRHLEATRSIAGDVDVVVWPENVVNIEHPFEGSEELGLIVQQAARLDAPIIVGVVEGVDEDHFVNYVVVVHPDGTISDRYDKERRVPFGEYVPMRWLFEPIARESLPQRDQVPGEGEAVVDTGHGRMAVAISWEIFFGRRVREGVRDGGQVVLNPTNGSSYWLTQVQTQQVAMSQLRAVESGRWTVQVSPTGFSAFVDPAGGVHQLTDISEEEVITRTIDRYDGTTPAQALGDVPGLVLAIGGLVAVVIVARRRRATAAPDTDDA
ncbi:apolipoprotein N-acyltransferase [Dermatobacter hominis]|uniref:apolipoprotein N-acyltransferase n=1 Tax=Dermatobacter hominis TaxID=2884263 RepID=UPI001D1164D6|nr:apolipoprotein N-acyltransferase [Dermatobacter hominis]UDY34614.1 apolipoprotein N-acyltransferase [Dermatobacter hominis]